MNMRKKNAVISRLIDRTYISYTYGIKVKINHKQKKLFVKDLKDNILSEPIELNSVSEELYLELCDFFCIDIKKYGVSSVDFKGNFIINANDDEDSEVLHNSKCFGEENYHIKLVLLVESILDGSYNPKYLSTILSKKKFYKYVEKRAEDDIHILMHEFDLKKLYSEMVDIYKEICLSRYFFIIPILPIRRKFIIGEQTEKEHMLYSKLRACSIKIHFYICE